MGGYNKIPFESLDQKVKDQFYLSIDEKFGNKKEDIKQINSYVQVVAGINIRFEYQTKNQNCEVIIWKKLDQSMLVTKNVCKYDII